MIKPLMKSVRRFMEACDQPVRRPAAIPPANEQMLRQWLLEEEFQEYKSSVQALRFSGDAYAREAAMIEIADALGDMMYVIAGTALSYGIDLDGVLKEICRSNESKIGKNGEVIKDDNGKVMKPKGYRPPRLEPIVYPPVKVK